MAIIGSVCVESSMYILICCQQQKRHILCRDDLYIGVLQSAL